MAQRTAFGVDEVEPYSKAVKGGGFVFVKSQIGRDPGTGVVADGIGPQTRYALEAIEKAVQAAGGTVHDLVKISIYLADIDRDFDAMGEAYAAFFADRDVAEPPARTTVGSSLSWPELLVQIDAVAAE